MTIKFKPILGEYERIAFAEVLIPDSPNVYGDLHSAENIRQFAYGFMINGFGIDIDHNNINVTSQVKIIESFIARAGDPVFVEGAWVVGILVLDDEIWEDILSGELNGFSYQAMVSVLPVQVVYPDIQEFQGVTYPDIDDGHVHSFYVMLDEDGRVKVGGTDEVRGHSHAILSHTYSERSTEGGDVHRHRYSLYRAVGDYVNEQAA